MNRTILATMRLGLLLLACFACGDHPAARRLGQDCTALLHAAERAQACDPVLAELSGQLDHAADETSCRRAARALLQPRTLSHISSVHERWAAVGEPPLDGDELKALQDLVLPATLLLTPDLRPSPGVPRTMVELAGTLLDSDELGRVEARVPPGRHDIRLRHAGEENSYCLELRPCTRTELVTHGAKLAPREFLLPGPCRPTPSPRP